MDNECSGIDLPMVRLGIKHSRSHMLKIISCTFSAYHLLKGRVRSGKIKMQGNERTQLLLRQSWSVFASAICAEAGELRIPHRAFSLSQFVVFCSTGDRVHGPVEAISQSATQDLH